MISDRRYNKLVRILESMNNSLTDCILDDRLRVLDLEKAYKFVFLYSVLKGVYCCGKRKGVELDKYLEDQTGLEFMNYIVLRDCRNLICHIVDDRDIFEIDGDLSNFDIRRFSLLNNFDIVLNANRIVREMRNSVYKKMQHK